MSQPSVGSASFTCPTCGVVAQQNWRRVALLYVGGQQVKNEVAAFDRDTPFEKTTRGEATALISSTGTGGHDITGGLYHATCTHCGAMSLWIRSRMIYPLKSSAPPPNPDLPAVAQPDYREAATVLPHSPRAAAALLRLCSEKLLGELLGKQGKIDAMIGDFVKLGVSPMLQEAMDVLRVTGNEAVHPGQMEEVDDLSTALSLFGLVNLIVDQMITQPKHVNQLFANLPAGKVEAIERRNAKARGE